jgi:hypothetical protein
MQPIKINRKLINVLNQKNEMSNQSDCNTNCKARCNWSKIFTFDGNQMLEIINNQQLNQNWG